VTGTQGKSYVIDQVVGSGPIRGHLVSRHCLIKAKLFEPKANEVAGEL